MALFKQKIRCSLCGKNHRSKALKNTHVYSCITYEKKGVNFCQRLPIHENVLLDYLQLKIRETPTKEYIQENLELIEISPEKVVIRIKNETPITISKNVIDIG
jgi:ssDNA-binding Zn-finger/Zn-ribbon topoisomerase 1